MPTSIGNISFGGRNLSDEEAQRVANQFAARRREQDERTARLPAIRMEGEAALRRLLPIAQGNTGQCRHVAAFLLGLYNGTRFPFDLTDLRAVDSEIFGDCMAVLQMDAQPAGEVHTYFENGGQVFEQLAQDWRIPDRYALRQVIEQCQLPGAPHLDELRKVRTEYLDSGKI
jgi:hypothetical protein